MKKNISTIIGITILFLGLALAPSINANVSKESELVEIITEICGLDGETSYPYHLTIKQISELNNLFNSHSKNAVYETEKFIYPLQNLLETSHFGDQRLYIYSNGNKQFSSHAGIDYGAKTGIEVFSIGSGMIMMAKERILTGLTAVIKHLPGVYSAYYHLSELKVTKGDIVKKGDVIGLVGNTGLSTASHLHLTVSVSGVPVDPVFFIENDLILRLSGRRESVESVGK